jgi:hypothetical protein
MGAAPLLRGGVFPPPHSRDVRRHRYAAILPVPGGRRHTGAAMWSDRYKYLAIIACILAALLGSQLLFKFYEWNRLQSCATAGWRNCAGKPIPLDR